MLATAGVLELVDEEVMDAVGECDGGVGGVAVFSAEDGLGDLGDLGEVDGGGFCEDDFELGGGVAEQGETGAEDGPVVVGVAKWREGTDGSKGGFEAGDGGEIGDGVSAFALFQACGRRESRDFCRWLYERCG